MVTWEGLSFNEKRWMLYLAAIIMASGYTAELISYNYPAFNALNIITLTLTVIGLVLGVIGKVTFKQAFAIITYTQVLNVAVHFHLSPNLFMDEEQFHAIAILGALIPACGLILGKWHTLYIGMVMFWINLPVLHWHNPIPVGADHVRLMVLTAGYFAGMFYLIQLIEKGTRQRKTVLSELEKQNRGNIFINTLALEMIASPSDAKIGPIILKSIKEYTNSPLALYFKYDSKGKILKINHIETEDSKLGIISEFIRNENISTNFTIDDQTYQIMLGEKIKINHSLTELSFGTISESQSEDLKKRLGLHTFISIVHEVSNQLYATTFIGLTNDREIPNTDILKSYSLLTSITIKRIMAERELLASEAKLRQITDQILDVVFISDLKLNIQYISPSIEKMTGYTPLERAQLPMKARFPLPSIEMINHTVAAELQNDMDPANDKTRTYTMDLELYHQNGETIDVSAHTSFIRSETGEPIGIQGIVRNVTARKKVERALMEREKELEQLIADKDRFMLIITHDLRSPFQSLIGFSDMLAMNLEDYPAEEVRDKLQIISQTAQNTYDLLSDLLLWSQAKAGKLTLNQQSIQLSLLCHNISDELKIAAQYKKLTIVNRVPDQIHLYADNNIVKTVLRNLLSNAIKFSYPNSDIHMDAETEGERVVIGISDSGVGITPMRQHQIWMNGQTSSQGTGKEQGTGNGLFLCKELVERHGGTIWMESDTNRGTTIKVAFPAQAISIIDPEIETLTAMQPLEARL